MNIGLHPDFIIEHVAIYLGTCKRAVMSKSRLATIVDARQVAMYITYVECGIKYAEIAEYFNRSQWDVRYHVLEAIQFRKIYPDYLKKVEMCKRHIIAQKLTEIAKYDIQHELVSNTDNAIAF